MKSFLKATAPAAVGAAIAVLFLVPMLGKFLGRSA